MFEQLCNSDMYCCSIFVTYVQGDLLSSLLHHLLSLSFHLWRYCWVKVLNVNYRIFHPQNLACKLLWRSLVFKRSSGLHLDLPLPNCSHSGESIHLRTKVRIFLKTSVIIVFLNWELCGTKMEILHSSNNLIFMICWPISCYSCLQESKWKSGAGFWLRFGGDGDVKDSFIIC